MRIRGYSRVSILRMIKTLCNKQWCKQLQTVLYFTRYLLTIRPSDTFKSKRSYPISCKNATHYYEKSGIHLAKVVYPKQKLIKES